MDDDPQLISVPCPRCGGTIEVLGTVVNGQLRLRGGGRCDDCGGRVLAGEDVPVIG